MQNNSLTYSIQSNIVCENCIKCNTRPVLEQVKNGWMIKCPNNSCNNSVTGKVIDFKVWDRQNKKHSIVTDANVKKAV
jgi:ssDNA-binding Zn-finger/Zn-ribbon topoisomerase 1